MNFEFATAGRIVFGAGAVDNLGREAAKLGRRVFLVPGVSGAKANIVWDPPWDQSRMSDEARLVLNMW